MYAHRKFKKSSTKKDPASSANRAYEEMNLKAKEKASGYENVEVILQSSGQGREGDKTRDRSIKFCISKSTASEYIDRDDAGSVYVVGQQQPL